MTMLSTCVEVMFVTAALLLMQLQDRQRCLCQQERVQLLQMCNQQISKLKEASLSLCFS